jgi:YfiH family protein
LRLAGERAAKLSAPHAFYGRAGGVSQGIYASLNCGPGSGDDPAAVEENRRRCADDIGVPVILTAYQTHSAVAAIVDRHDCDKVSRADALVTKDAGIGIGVLAADCIPILAEADGVVAAIHAGWRGSLGGIIAAAIGAMRELGADPARISAAMGPCLRAPAFQVGADLRDEVTSKYPAADQFFGPDPSAEDRFIYDHLAFAMARLEDAGIHRSRVEVVGGDTLQSSERYFSYRASRQIGASDYGRNLSAIAPPAA